MGVPTQQYMTLSNGASNATYTGNKIKMGDIIRISNSDSNDGIFTVSDVVHTLDTASATGSNFTDATCDTTDGSKVVNHNANANIVAGLSVSGTGVNGTSYITTINSSTQFTMNDNSNSSQTDTTITFSDADIYYVLRGRGVTAEVDSDKAVTITVQRAPGDKLFAFGRQDEISGTTYGIDVWSYNALSSPASQNDGWTQSAINPTFSGSDAKYIFHFADEALRVCNINEANSSIIKWYGYIQRNQFSLDEGLSFNEWQEHPNTLAPPANSGGISFGFLTSSHSATVAANYYNVDTVVRGVKYILRDNVSDLRLDGDGSALASGATTMIIENTTPVHILDQLSSGNIVSFGATGNNLATDMAALQTEHIFIKRRALDSGSITIEKGHGGSTAAAIADESTPVIVRGAAFNIAVTEDTTSGLWQSNSWEFYQTFIYDDSQESLPVQVGDGAEAVAASYLSDTSGNLKLKVSVYADMAYNGRITGGRFYIREKGSADPLTLLADIDIVRGVRTSMLDDHTAWAYNSNNAHGFYVVGLLSEGPSIDTYTSLNGFSSEEGFISMGVQGEMYKASTIAGRRTFIANVKIRNKTNDIIKHGDRIMYSEINKFDTFLESNFIDVSKGDFGEYVALESFADRLLAFKHNLVHIINISNPNPSAWFLEDTVKYFGVSYPFSVTKTEFGIAWINEAGCFIYDGERVSNLIERKLGVSEVTIGNSESWNDFINGSANTKDAMIGYDAVSNSLIVMRSPNDASDLNHYSFIYDFDSGGWTSNNNMFVENRYYTNFTHDWNNNLVVAREVDDSDDDAIELQKYLPVSTASSNQQFITRDIDFGESGIIKKVYSVTVTYRSTAAQTTPFEYAVDGKKIFSNFTGDLSVTFDTASSLNDGSGINTTDTSITATDASFYSVGDTVLINTEQMMVHSIKGNVLTCSRAHNGTTAASHSDNAAMRTLQWDVATLTPSSPISCQSIQLRFNPASSGNMEINDITIEWRPLRVKAVS
jgi:hypothetical protein